MSLLTFHFSVNCNYIANYPLTTVFLAKYQLTANPIGTLIQAQCT